MTADIPNQMSQKVAVVTGANKGIGYAIVKGICEKFQGRVYLTARNENRGKEAVSELNKLGLHPEFHQLDITNPDSINKFKDYIKETEGGIDILVNNAAIAFMSSSTVSEVTKAELTIETNYFGTFMLCESLFPLLRDNAQVVNMSSAAGHLSRIPSSDLRSKFSNTNLTVTQLNSFMKQYISDVKNNTHRQNGWGDHSYVVSKVGVSALTILQQREFDKEPSRNISINSVHPGFVDTDMNMHKGTLTIEDGARAPLFLALGGHEIKGQYIWKDCTVLDWYGSGTPELH